jgi:hypothetical protein
LDIAVGLSIAIEATTIVFIVVARRLISSLIAGLIVVAHFRFGEMKTLAEMKALTA